MRPNTLNINADTFVPLSNKVTDDDLSAKKVLHNLKILNANKIVIGY